MTRGRRNNGRNRRRNNRGNGNVSTGPSRFPTGVLTRTFRTSFNIELNNTAGSGLQRYMYFSKYYQAEPKDCYGFADARRTFELWRLKRFRCRIQPGYNGYNQSYNTINQDAIAAMQIWTSSDPSDDEQVSGVSIKSYNNAKVHTLSLNGIKTIVNTACRLNTNSTPKTILPASTWLSTVNVQTDVHYSGFQLFAQMSGGGSTDYLPVLQVIFEYDCEFKQPGWQNIPSTFESQIIGAELTTQPDSSDPSIKRVYEVVAYTINAVGNLYRLERKDGEPGSLEYTMSEFYQLYVNQTSGKYFNDSPISWNGPIPQRPDASYEAFPEPLARRR